MEAEGASCAAAAQVVTNPINNILEGGGRSSLQTSHPSEEVPLLITKEEALASVRRDSRAAEEQRKQGREEQKLLDNWIQK